MRLVFMGTPAFAVPSLEGLAEAGLPREAVRRSETTLPCSAFSTVMV